jgi:ribosomal protein S18 acetylase RimI-like enzyme
VVAARSTGTSFSIRRASPDDYPWIITIGALVYHDLGDYAQILPSWLAQPGVLVWIESEHDTPRGFAVLGFYTEPAGALQVPVADLLAIAVAPHYQRRGVGTALLGHVISVASRVGPSNHIHELRLTVAETNRIGMDMYERAGFRVVEDATGSYAGGQRAIRMARPLP